jgi:chromosome segregation ATPase
MSTDIENQKKLGLLEVRTELPDFNFRSLENDQDGNQDEEKNMYLTKIRELIKVHIKKLSILADDNEKLSNREFELAKKIKDLEKQEKDLEIAFNKANEDGEMSRNQMRILEAEIKDIQNDKKLIEEEKLLLKENIEKYKTDIDKYETEITQLQSKLALNDNTIKELQDVVENFKRSGNVDAITISRASELEKEISNIKNYNNEKNLLLVFIDEKIRDLKTSSDKIFSDYNNKKKMHDEKMLKLTNPKMYRAKKIGDHVMPVVRKELQKKKDQEYLERKEERRKREEEDKRRQNQDQERTNQLLKGTFTTTTQAQQRPESPTNSPTNSRPDSPLSETSVLSRDFNFDQQPQLSETSDEEIMYRYKDVPEKIPGNYFGQQNNPNHPSHPKHKDHEVYKRFYNL